MKILALLLLFQQDPAIEKELKFANDTKRPAVMGQAIMKLVKRGNAAVPHILAWVEKNGFNALSLALTDTLGKFDDDRITELCLKLIEDREFFWRPAATRSLSDRAGDAHRDFLRKLLADRLWGVRAAAVVGLEKLNDKESIPALKKLLPDEIYDVRAQAAKTLYAMGDPSGIPILVEALSANTMWFEIDYGQIAREDAWKFLKKLSGDTFGYKPWEGKRRRTPGLKKWHEWMDKRDPEWRDKVPETAKSREDKRDYRFGFEIRSCQKGDFFFRLDSNGNLVMGYFNLISVKLSDEDLNAIQDMIKVVRTVDTSQAYGMGGCDYEQYYLRMDDDSYDKLWVGVGGRPDKVEKFIDTAARLIKDNFGAGFMKEFRDKSSLFRYID